jgi:hypothetical protein
MFKWFDKLFLRNPPTPFVKGGVNSSSFDKGKRGLSSPWQRKEGSLFTLAKERGVSPPFDKGRPGGIFKSHCRTRTHRKILKNKGELI